jgi:GTP cyclohydrolase I
MNNHTMKRCAAAAIRELLKYEGVETIYNNTYKTGTRTIKVYQRALQRSDVDLPRFKERVQDVADAFNFDVKFRTTKGRMWGAPAFIIAL